MGGLKRRSSLASGYVNDSLDDVRIRAINALLPPICLIEELPCEPHHAEAVSTGRAALQRVFDGQVIYVQEVTDRHCEGSCDLSLLHPVIDLSILHTLP